MEGPMRGFIAIFEDVEDPRAGNARHDLLELLFIALAAVLCGAESCADMADFGAAKEDVLREVLRLEHGIPSHDTFSRVFRLLDPEAFEAAFTRFMAAFAKGNRLKGVVAIDGKAIKGAFAKGAKATPLHLVNVWAAEQRLALAQRLAPGRNEVAGALEVVKLLSLKGCIVTVDALHCHRAMAQAIIDAKGQYALALKENQSGLFAAVERRFAELDKADTFGSEMQSSHGRSEQRTAKVITETTLAKTHDFPGIRALAQVDTVRRIEGKPDETRTRYFLLSKAFPADKLLHVVRTHWTIENQLHWVLDVVFNEDGARNRKDNGPQNIALLRKIALNLLRSHPDKASIRRKIKKAGWDDIFLLSILAQMR
jgi:predicted transposase YbfD/YdcC